MGLELHPRPQPQMATKSSVLGLKTTSNYAPETPALVIKAQNFTGSSPILCFREEILKEGTVSVDILFMAINLRMKISTSTTRLRGCCLWPIQARTQMGHNFS